MRRTVGAIALLLLLAAGVVVNSLKPSPSAKTRESVGEKTTIGPYVYYKSGLEPCVLLLPSLGREASDFNELILSLNSNGHDTAAIQAGGIDKSPLSAAKRMYDAAFAIQAVSSKCKNQEVILIGHAFGNRVVRDYAHYSKIQDNFDVSPLGFPTLPPRIKGVILLAAGGQTPMPPKAEQSLKNIFKPLRTYRSRMKKDIHDRH